MGTHYRTRRKRRSHVISTIVVILMAFGVMMIGGTAASAADDTTDPATVTSEEPVASEPETPAVEEVVTEPETPTESEPLAEEPVVETNEEPAATETTPAKVDTPSAEVAPANSSPADPPADSLAVDKTVVKTVPVDSTGTVTYETATCESPWNTTSSTGVPGGRWVYTDVNNATYKSADGGGVTTAVNNGGVPGGLAFGNITITIEDVNPNDGYNATFTGAVWLTVDPTTLECGNPNPEPTCVAPEDVNLSYTFDGISAGTVTATSDTAEAGTKLCDPLAVRATTWKYVLPASGSPSWPQMQPVYNDVLVDSIGVFSYAAPGPDKCVQFDIYAARVSDGGFDALKLPETLNESGMPFEPQFLSEALPNKGPNTWLATTSEGCNTTPPPVVVAGKASFDTLSCESESSNYIETDKVPGSVWVLTDHNDATYTSAVGGDIIGGVPGGLAFGDITVALSDADATDGYVVTPWSGVWSTVNPESLDCTVTPPPPVVVTGTATFESLTCTVGSKNWTVAPAVNNGVWTFTDKNGASFTTLPGVAYMGGVPEGLAFGPITVALTQSPYGEDYSQGDDGDSVNYVVTPWVGTWNAVEPASLSCATAVVTGSTWHPASTTLPLVLASTGANDDQLRVFGIGGISAIIVGAALLFWRTWRLRRREVVVQD